jgi:hypothetical protein
MLSSCATSSAIARTSGSLSRLHTCDASSLPSEAMITAALRTFLRVLIESSGTLLTDPLF